MYQVGSDTTSLFTRPSPEMTTWSIFYPANDQSQNTPKFDTSIFITVIDQMETPGIVPSTKMT